MLEASNTYGVSFWVKINPGSQFGIQYVEQSSRQAFNTVYTYNQLAERAIDGWARIEQTFVYDGAPGYLEVTPYYGAAYLDDLRIYPVDGIVRSYVYNDYRKPEAVMDENNYATFYRYNSRQDLVTINKETTEGIYTVQTGYKHKRNQ